MVDQYLGGVGIPIFKALHYADLILTGITQLVTVNLEINNESSSPILLHAASAVFLHKAYALPTLLSQTM